jgi:hypothetical protein
MGAPMKVTLKTISQHERISELLRMLGHDNITIEEFWQEMRRYGLTDEDIDTFCSGKHVE